MVNYLVKSGDKQHLTVHLPYFVPMEVVSCTYMNFHLGFIFVKVMILVITHLRLYLPQSKTHKINITFYTRKRQPFDRCLVVFDQSFRYLGFCATVK